MPIYLFSGVGGSSKTLNAVRLIKEDPVFRNRPVFYFNIKEVVFDDWIELSEDEAKRWYELPAGSVIFMDECQKVFRLTDHKKETPKFVTELETHRHGGFDIVCTTQHPMLTATGFRRQVGKHWHFERQFGFERARCLKWERLVKEPVDDFHARKEAVVENIKFPKKYYGTYKSTEINTFKRQIPKKLYFIGLMIFIVVGGSINFALDLTSRYGVDDTVAVATSVGEVVTGKPARQEHTFQPHYPLDPQEYLDVFKPRIKGLAHTAPAYDELTKPQRAPKTICIRVHRSSGSMCNCFTEQATRLQVPLNRCSNIVDNGLYDPTIPPVSYSSSGRQITTQDSNRVPVNRDRVKVKSAALSERIHPTSLPPVKAVF